MIQTYQARMPVRQFMGLKHVEMTLPEGATVHAHVRVGAQAPGERVTIRELVEQTVSWLERHGIGCSAVHTVLEAPRHPEGQVTLTVAATLPKRGVAA